MLKGKKSYVVASLTILFGVLGWLLGAIEPEMAIQTILGGLAIAGLRHGMVSK